MKNSTRLFLGVALAFAIVSLLLFLRRRAVINDPGELHQARLPAGGKIYGGIVKQYLFLPWYMLDY